MRCLLPILCWLVILAGAAALRLTDLDNRRMHCDEANQGDRFRRLLELRQYDYSPEEHHGPSLNYLTLPIAGLSGAETFAELNEIHLRLVPAIFGIVLVGLFWLLREELGQAAALSAAALTALSPAMVFYSRYYIQEMLLVCFSFVAIVAFRRYLRQLALRETEASGPAKHWRPRGVLWLLLLGMSIGLMHASKETCIIAWFAMAAAAVVTWGQLRRAGWRQILLGASIVLITAACVSALLFSAFLTNGQDVIESYTTYSHYVARVLGEGEAGPHDYPWYRYFQWYFWHPQGGPMRAEALIAVLALVGLLAAVWGKGLGSTGRNMARFAGIYAVLMTFVYCAIPYKTPWCALGFLHGMILLAGIGAAAFVRAMRTRYLRLIAVLLLLAAADQLGWQARQASFANQDDHHSPYLYAHTSGHVPRLVNRIEQIADNLPDGRAIPIQIICPEDDYWPLPWYLRSFSRVGCLNGAPHGPPAPLIITQPALESLVAEYIYAEQLPDLPCIYVPILPEEENEDWQLRPNVPLRVYLRQDVWETYQRRL